MRAFIRVDDGRRPIQDAMTGEWGVMQLPRQATVEFESMPTPHEPGERLQGPFLVTDGKGDMWSVSAVIIAERRANGSYVGMAVGAFTRVEG